MNKLGWYRYFQAGLFLSAVIVFSWLVSLNELALKITVGAIISWFVILLVWAIALLIELNADISE